MLKLMLAENVFQVINVEAHATGKYLSVLNAEAHSAHQGKAMFASDQALPEATGIQQSDPTSRSILPNHRIHSTSLNPFLYCTDCTETLFQYSFK